MSCMRQERPEIARVRAKAKAMARDRKLRERKGKEKIRHDVASKENNRPNTLIVRGTCKRRPNGTSGLRCEKTFSDEVEEVAARERVEKERDLRAAQERIALFQWYNKLTRRVLREWAVEVRRLANARKVEEAKVHRAESAWGARAKKKVMRAWYSGQQNNSRIIGARPQTWV